MPILYLFPGSNHYVKYRPFIKKNLAGFLQNYEIKIVAM